MDVRAGCGAGRYDRTMLGIFPVGDLTEVVEADADASAVILEEPEHCAPERLLALCSAPELLLGTGSAHVPNGPRMTPERLHPARAWHVRSSRPCGWSALENAYASAASGL